MRVRIAEPPASAVKLIELDLNGRLQKPHLHQQLPRYHGGFRNSEERRKQIRQVEIERSKRGNKLLDLRRVGVREVHLVIQLSAQPSPVELHERVLLGDFTNNFVGNSCAVSQARKVELAHFSAAAHVVHQVERIPFAADKSHGFTSNQRHSV